MNHREEKSLVFDFDKNWENSERYKVFREIFFFLQYVDFSDEKYRN